MPLLVNIEQTIDFAQIAWAIVALFGLGALTYLFSRGILRNAELDLGDKKFSLGSAPGQRTPTKAEQAMLAMAQMTEEKYQTANNIKALQKRAIEDYYDTFMDALHDADYLPAELLWRHFSDPLVNAAEENHIISHLDGDGNLMPSYIAEKVIFVQTRHARMCAKKRGCLPEWSTIEPCMKKIMDEALSEFAKIAKQGWGTFRGKVQAVRVIAPKMAFLLDRLVENV